MDQTIEPLREGLKVSARVIKVTPSGIVVEVAGRQRGIIRNRELSWKRTLDETEPKPVVGEQIEAVVVSVDPDSGTLELSLKRAGGDPWEKVGRGSYRPGGVFQAEVVNLESYGAFVEIEPGIDGLVHKSQIPGGKTRDIQDLLWIGDQVQARITEIDLQHRRLAVSITEFLDERRKNRRPAKSQPDVSPPAALDVDADMALYLTRLAEKTSGRRIRRILIVDDDTSFAAGLAEWLGRLQYRVDVMSTGQDAASTEVSYDLAFVDIDLPDGNGLAVADALLARNPSTEIIVITGLTWFQQGVDSPPDLRISGAILKPLDFGEVLNVLSAAEKGPLERVRPKDSAIGSRDLEFLRQISTTADVQQDMNAALDRLLDGLQARTQARSVILFQMDPFTQSIAALASKGWEHGAAEQDGLQSLRFSAVKSVALDGQEIAEDNAMTSKRFEALLRLFPFESCVAVPVPAVNYDARYALFLFDPGPDAPLPAHQAQALSVSHLISAAIQQDYVRALITRSQRTMLVGQLAASLMHELRNKVNDIEQQARLLQLDCHDLAEGPRGTPMITWAGRLGGRVKQTLTTNAELRGLTLQYLGLMGKEKQAVENVNDLILRAVASVGPLARESRVEVVCTLEPQMPATSFVALRLEQTLLNVALNAVQQMGAQKPKGGVLHITSAYEPADAARPIKVRFTDEGPGIHRKLWRWIFEMGTSTREEGTGLGLFISQGLLESMGGKISVETSLMYAGSTFLIELPAIPSPEVGNERQ